MILKTNTQNSLKLINERNQKSLFLFLFLPWLTSVVASISSTSQGYVLLSIPKDIEDMILEVVFKNIEYDGARAIVVGLCNFLTDLVLFSAYMMYKNRFALKRKLIISLLFIGHSATTALSVISLINQDVQMATKSGLYFILPVSLFIVVFRYLPRKYVDILSPYSVLFIAQEIQFLSKTNRIDHDIVKSKKRLGLYVSALLTILSDGNSETKQIVVIQKWKSLEQANKQELARAISDFCNYLNSTFSIQIRGPELTLDFDSLTNPEKLLRNIVLKVDDFASVVIYSPTIFPKTLELIQKSRSLKRDIGLESTLSNQNKDVKKVIKYYLNQANEVDTVSARQKIYAAVGALFVYLISPTMIYILNIEQSAPHFPTRHFWLLIVQYFSTFMVAYFSTSLIEDRFRKSGISVIVPQRLLGYFANGVIILIFLVTWISGDDIVRNYVSLILSQNLTLAFIGLAILQTMLLFIFIKPPAELRKSSAAIPLLVRELLFLRAHIFSSRSIKDLRQIGRYIYFVKKYFRLIAEDLINSRYDAASEKSRLREYFISINDYLDNLSTQVKLGDRQNRENAVAQIENLILMVSFEDFGKIPEVIPGIQKHLNIKLSQPKPPSLVRQIFKFIDTSALARTIVIILAMIVINVLNPSLWEYIQNISSLFQLMTP